MPLVPSVERQVFGYELLKKTLIRYYNVKRMKSKSSEHLQYSLLCLLELHEQTVSAIKRLSQTVK